MARLLSNDYSSTKALQANLEKLDLYSDEFKGDVRKFTETVKSSYEILSQREKRDANGRLTGRTYVPPNLSHDLLTIFSNSGNTEFDELFNCWQPQCGFTPNG